MPTKLMSRDMQVLNGNSKCNHSTSQRIRLPKMPTKPMVVEMVVTSSCGCCTAEAVLETTHKKKCYARNDSQEEMLIPTMLIPENPPPKMLTKPMVFKMVVTSSCGSCTADGCCTADAVPEAMDTAGLFAVPDVE